LQESEDFVTEGARHGTHRGRKKAFRLTAEKHFRPFEGRGGGKGRPVAGFIYTHRDVKKNSEAGSERYSQRFAAQLCK